VPVRNRYTAGVQVPPKLSVLIDYAERGNPSLRPPGRLIPLRRDWRFGVRCHREANALL